VCLGYLRRGRRGRERREMMRLCGHEVRIAWGWERMDGIPWDWGCMGLGLHGTGLHRGELAGLVWVWSLRCFRLRGGGLHWAGTASKGDTTDKFRSINLSRSHPPHGIHVSLPPSSYLLTLQTMSHFATQQQPQKPSSPPQFWQTFPPSPPDSILCSEGG